MARSREAASVRVSGGRLAVAAPRGQAPTLRIELFGTMRVEADGAPLHASMRTEALRLLAFLIVRRHSPLARDQVAFTLWPDSTEESARATLRRQLYNLRIGVPATQKPLLEVDGEMLQWNAHAGVLVDVVEFERCADRDDAGAVEFYAGDLLEQMDDEWVMPERTRLRALYVEVLWRLASRARARRDVATAESYLQRLLSTDPWREDAVRALMSVRYENGDAAAALAACADFETRLRDEIGAGLMRETVQLREAIVRHEPIARPAVANNLPAHTSSFVGRDDDVAHIATLVRAQSLVTLVGAGGVGKTRTAIHVGAMLLDEYDDGVWLIELAPLVHARQIAPTAATVLGVRSSADKPALDALLNDVAKRRMLILLDNCEHIVEGAAAFVDAILRAAPNVHVLATSRESLRASEETVYRLPSLAYPSANGTLTAEQAARYGAIALFASRAGAANPAVRLTDETAPLVCELCRRLDGIALAIELAAARVNVLSLPEIAQGLDDRFRLLAVGKRTALRRHQTMRALIDWSYDLLTVQERALLRRVAIFASGWTLAAAEAVCADEVLPAPELFELHASLVDKSLVVADVGAQTTRYRLLESTRAYGRERLAQAVEYDAVARRLAAWGVQFADGMYELLWSTPIARWLTDVEPERENLRAALTWCLDAGHDALLGARIAGSLSGLWSLGGLREEGRRAIEDALAQLEPDAHPGVEGRLWRGLAGLSVARRQVEAAQRAIALFEHSMNRAELADTYRQLSTGLFDMDRMQEAEAASRRALELYREAGRSGTRRYAITMQGLAGILLRLGRVDQARETLMAGVWVPENLRDTAAATLMSLGELEFSEGHAALALAHCNEAAAIGAALRDQRIQAAAACNAAGYHLALAQYDEARACGAESLELSARGLDERLCTVAMLHLAAVAAERGDARRGALLLGYTDAWFSKEHCAYEFTEQRSRDAARARLRTALHEETAAALEAYGRALTQAQALAEARAV